MNAIEPHLWQKLKITLDQAAALSGPEQVDFLEEKLGYEPSLLALAQHLLLQHQATNISPKAMRLGWQASSPEPDDRVGTQLGPYHIQKKLGSGGMGHVYLAERHMDGVMQKVALKILKRGLDTETILQRFQHEKRILARLNHPHIATFLDSGMTPDQLPYLVMTYVEGQTLFSYCRSKALSLKERLVLFRKICLAVHFAHQNLVVHRDLKPGNLLITEQGEPRLLDFGIAKWLMPDTREHEALTQDGQKILTPEYASPEQFTGAAITTASDVYTLGILFYELVAGVRPFANSWHFGALLSGAGSFPPPVKPSVQLMKAIHSEFPATPPLADAFSEKPRQEATQRVRQLRGDLDNMARKAMQLQPENRYGSALQFAEDITRYLQQKPISARRESFGYSLSKWVQRNKMAVNFSAALAFLVLIFGAFSAKKQRDLAAQEQIAASAQEKSQHITRFMSETFAAAEPFEGDLCDITATMLIQQAAQRLVAEEHLSPKLKASLIESIAQIYQEPGLLNNAENMLFQELEKQIAAASATPRVHAQTHHMLGHFHLKNGDFDNATHHLKFARETYPPHMPETLIHMADVESALGEIARHQGNQDRAKSHQAKALTFSEKSGESTPSEKAKILKRLAATQRRTGEAEKAAETLELALVQIGHSENYSVARSEMETDLGLIYRGLGQLDKAETLFKKGIAKRTQAFGEESPWTANLYDQLAKVYVAQGAFLASEEAFQTCYRIRKHQLAPDHPDLLSAQKNLASNLLFNGKFAKAEPLLARIWNGPILQSWDLCDPRRLEYELLQARVHLGLAQWSQADRHLKNMEALLANQDRSSPYLGDLKLFQGELAVGQGEFTLAEARFEEALAIFSTTYTPTSYLVGTVYLKQAAYHLRCGAWIQARISTDHALHIFAANPQRFSTFIGEGLAILAEIHNAKQSRAASLALHQEARRLLVSGYGADSDHVLRLNTRHSSSLRITREGSFH